MPDNAAFYWNELHATDVEEAKKFYQATLGWTYEEMPHGADPNQKYTIAKANGKPVAGIMISPIKDEEEDEEGAAPQWVAYIHVDDVDAAVAKAEKAGGEVVMPCFDVPGVGRIAMVVDSAGAPIGLMTAKPAA